MESPSNFQVKEKKFIQIGLETTKFDFVVQTVIWGEYNIEFGIPIKIPSKRKKIIQIGPETTKLDCCGQDSHFGKVQFRI